MFGVKRSLMLMAGLLRMDEISDSCNVCQSQFRTAILLPRGGIACGRPIADRYLTRADAKKCRGCALLYKKQKHYLS